MNSCITKKNLGWLTRLIQINGRFTTKSKKQKNKLNKLNKCKDVFLFKLLMQFVVKKALASNLFIDRV